MEITGNVAAVTGLDFKTASEQIQRSLSAGIASADLFRERGVRDLLGFKAGATVTAEETAEAFKRVFGQGGQFGGATDELAKTFEGTLSMIGDKFFTFKKTILEAGFFPELKKQFGDLNKFLEDNGKVIDDIATKIGVGLALAVESTANAFKFLKDNFDAVVLVLQTMVAIKVATFFYGMTMSLKALTFAMTGFNIATKRNIIFGSLTVFASAMGFMIHKFKEFKGELDVGSMSLKELNEQISLIENKKAIKSLENYRDKASDFRDMNAKLLILEEEKIYKLKAHHQAMGKNMQQMKDSVALGFKQNENTKQEIKNEKEKIDLLIKRNFLQDRMKDEQIGMSDRDQAKINEKTQAQREQDKQNLIKSENEKLRIIKHAHIDRVFEQDRMLDEQIGLNTNELKEFNNIYNQKKKIEEEYFDNYTKAMLKRGRINDEVMTKELTALASFSEGFKEQMNSQGTALEQFNEAGKRAFDSFADTLANTLVTGKFAFQDFARSVILDITKIIAKQMIMIALQKAAGFFGFGGFSLGGLLGGRAGGGAVNKGQPYMVGEKGPEMFVPSGSGKIVPNNKVGGGQPVTVNFNINTVDARGFNELLVNSRGVIINMINSAVNEKGRMAIV